MASQATTDLRIAISEGLGSGRFLAVSMLDALDSGGDLQRLCVSQPVRARGHWTVDFVFQHWQPAYREVIRAGLDVADRVISAELLRSTLDGGGQPEERRYVGQTALARALRTGDMVEFVKLEASEDPGAPRAVRLQLRRGEPYLLELSRFERVSRGS
jgi:hypothetical protein